MPGKHGLIDRLKHIAYEDEPEKTPASATPSATPAATPTFATPPFTAPAFAPTPLSAAPQPGYMPPIDAGVVPDSDEAYRRLLSKTDFEATDVAATIHKY